MRSEIVIYKSSHGNYPLFEVVMRDIDASITFKSWSEAEKFRARLEKCTDADNFKHILFDIGCIPDDELTCTIMQSAKQRFFKSRL